MEWLIVGGVPAGIIVIAVIYALTKGRIFGAVANLTQARILEAPVKILADIRDHLSNVVNEGEAELATLKDYVARAEARLLSHKTVLATVTTAASQASVVTADEAKAVFDRIVTELQAKS